MADIPGSDIRVGLLPCRYLSSFQDGGFFSDVTTCQICASNSFLLYNNNALVHLIKKNIK